MPITRLASEFPCLLSQCERLSSGLFIRATHSISSQLKLDIKTKRKTTRESEEREKEALSALAGIGVKHTSQLFALKLNPTVESKLEKKVRVEPKKRNSK